MNDATTTLRGGCACGSVRYEVSGPAFHRTLCHCATCRRVAAAPAVAWFSVRPQGYRVYQGPVAAYRSSAHVARTFCPTCGTHLTYARDGLDEVDVTTCSLDDPEALAPTDQTFFRSRLRWMDGAAALPHHPTTRDAPGEEAGEEAP